MITAVIIDDEQKNISMLISLLQDYCPQVCLLGSARSAAEGKQLIEDLKPQLVLLDVEMPYGSGFDLLQSIPGLQTEVIFITAYDQYALNAFRYAALDYLLKPVNIEQLCEAVQRAGQKIKEKNTMRNYELLLHNLDEKDISKQSIALNDKGQQHLVQLADIIYIIADGSYTHIHTRKRSFVSTKNLKDFEQMLPAGIFCRIHHGHIVNKRQIDKIQKGRGGAVLMKDGRKLEIAVRRKEEFLKMLKE
jgi:two-component system, LytTR family, response regulator